MGALIVFLLLCASLLGAEGDVRVVTTVRTNDSGSVYTTEVFTRAGQTNLVRTTVTEAGAVQIRIHRFYHSGTPVAIFVAMPHSSGITTEAGSAYSLSFEFDASHKPTSAVIGTKDGVVLDLFRCTNGIFTPVEGAVIQKANAVIRDLKQLFDPEHVRKTSPEDFARAVQDLIEKHKEK
ncbi:hypothetical protein G4L39_11955 [Limisphaera ngatamarikiensis]|uniref:Uncharacterized protein n=1 Tax=Limisphaera ngatamarikiensis TaxID=1324935 RepID=A0A6M1S481_9BACT|nr:hypothetical protein [Limisphaera ngatamarikiensis]NGO40100.1 hypothetical protein [Limisphaera ngatamarikiensis]